MRQESRRPVLCRLRFLPASLGILLALTGSVLAQTYSTTPPPPPTMGESISSGFKDGVDKIGKALAPADASRPADDPVLLSTKAKPSCELYVAVARLYVEANRLSEAEAQYKKALRIKADYLPALLGYAQLKDQMGLPLEALKLYHQAAKAHPREPAVYNNLSVHYAQREMYREAVTALEGAIRLSPAEAKYRNNMAAFLVELRRPQEAFDQLRAVHGEAASHYNLGYLLQKKNQSSMAAQQFALALQVDPSLVEAREWLVRLHGVPPQAMMANRGGPAEMPRPDASLPRGEVRMASRPQPYEPTEGAPLPPGTVEDDSPGGRVLNPHTLPASANFVPPDNRPGPSGYPQAGYPWPRNSASSATIQRLPPTAPAAIDDGYSRGSSAPLPPGN